METWRFDPNEPPPMPLSALLLCPRFMWVVRRLSPSMVYGIRRDARRDARQVAAWMQWAIFKYVETLWWHETHAQPLIVQPVNAR